MIETPIESLSTLDASPALKTTVAECVKWSENNVIANADDYKKTHEHVIQTKTDRSVADQYFDGPIQQAFQLHRSLIARKKAVTDSLDRSEAIDKAKMLAFDKAQEAAAKAEAKRLQDIEDEATRKRQEADRIAAAQQREIADEAKRKADALRIEAEAADEKDRKKFLADAAKLETKAETATERAEIKQQESFQHATPVVHVPAGTTRIAGVARKSNWKAAVVDFKKFFSYCAANNRDDLVLANEKMLDSLAKQLKERADIPGVEFKNHEQMAIGRR